MPLITNETIRVEIEGTNEWYDIRQRLGWYQKKKASMSDSIQLAVSTQAVERGQVEADDTVKVELSPADVQQRLFMAYLVRWSHREPLSKKNVNRIPPDHADAILAKIKELQAQEEQEKAEVPTPSSTG